MATTVSFKRPDGQIIQGYLAEPEHAAGAAAVVIIQEWWAELSPEWVGRVPKSRAPVRALAGAPHVALGGWG